MMIIIMQKNTNFNCTLYKIIDKKNKKNKTQKKKRREWDSRIQN